jgi:hypothetical protein
MEFNSTISSSEESNTPSLDTVVWYEYLGIPDFDS